MNVEIHPFTRYETTLTRKKLSTQDEEEKEEEKRSNGRRHRQQEQQREQSNNNYKLHKHNNKNSVLFCSCKHLERARG